MSMAAGEYVSVSSQGDSEQADLARERRELVNDAGREHDELAAIYMGRGLDAFLAQEVARQLMAHDALGAHSRDELGLSDATLARPVQAASASAVSFSAGAALPLIVAALAPPGLMAESVAAASLLFLALLGAVGAKAGGAGLLKAMVRVMFWGAVAMAITAGIGAIL